MPEFRFRLTTLMRLREQTRDERRAKLAEAYAAEQVLRDRRAMIDRELANTALLQKRSASGAVNVDSLLDVHRYQMVLKAEQQVVEKQSEMLATEIEKRRQALVAADREVRVLEKLREKQHDRFQHDQAVIAQKQLDEMASRMPTTGGTLWAD